MRRLIREGNPPSGQLASPVPQYWNPSTEAFEDVLGAHGAPRAILYGPNGQPISQSNPLEVRVRELEAELAAMRGMLETGNAKVTLTGRIVDKVTLLDAVALTDGTRKFVILPKADHYREVEFYVRNTLDVNVRIAFGYDSEYGAALVTKSGTACLYYTTGTGNAYHEIPPMTGSGAVPLSWVPVSNAELWDPQPWKKLVGIAITHRVSLIYHPVGTPTSGALTIAMVGRV